MGVCTLLTDFGTRDYYVGAVRGTLLRLAPQTQVVDLTHEVEPGNVAAASFLLAAAAPTFPSGTVHLAVVDPGVGSARRILALRYQRCYFVAPDNGLLTPFLDHADCLAVDRSDLYLAAPGQTFHGRDRFAPVAAFLCRGGSLADLGAAMEEPVRLAAPKPERDGPRLHGSVRWIDRFGNVVTDLPNSWLPEGPFSAVVGAATIDRSSDFYAELEDGEPALLRGSSGTLECALRGASCAVRYAIAIGDAIDIVVADSDCSG